MAKRAKQQRGAPKKLVGVLRAKVLKKIEDGCSMKTAAASVGICSSTLHKTRREDEQFDQEVEAAKERRLAKLELEANRRALDGSDTMLKLLLQVLDPETYSRPLKHEHSGPEGKPIETNATISLESLSDDECRNLVAILEKAKGSEPRGSES